MEIKENKNKIAVDLTRLKEMTLCDIKENKNIKHYPAMYKTSFLGKQVLIRKEGYYDIWGDKITEEEIEEMNCYISNEIVYCKPKLILTFKESDNYVYVGKTYEEVYENFVTLMNNPIVKANFCVLNFNKKRSFVS